MSSSSSLPSSSVSSASTPAAPSAPATAIRRPRAGAPLILAAAALWGTTGTVAAQAPAGVSPLTVGAATMGVGGLLTFLAGLRPTLAVLRGGRAAVRDALLGACGVIVYPLAFYTSMAWAGVAVGTVVSLGSAPVFSALLERLVDGTRLSRRWSAATAAAAAGCAALVLGAPSQDAGGRAAAGVALGLLAGAGYAGYAYQAARLITRGYSSRGAMGAVFGLGAVVLLPLFAATGGPLTGEPRGLAIVAYLAVVPMWLAYVLFGAGLARVPVSAATTLTLFEPVVAALLGVLVVGERLGAAGWSGVALVTAGLLALTVRR
jgi:DME family drug/metabolite transporter